MNYIAINQLKAVITLNIAVILFLCMDYYLGHNFSFLVSIGYITTSLFIALFIGFLLKLLSIVNKHNI